MNNQEIKDKYIAKKAQLHQELQDYIEQAINYDELIEAYGDKDNISRMDLLWNSSNDQRYYDTLNQMLYITDSIIDIVGSMDDIGNDKKKLHNAKKKIESCISDFRHIRKESKKIVEQEETLVSEVNDALDLLDAL